MRNKREFWLALGVFVATALGVLGSGQYLSGGILPKCTTYYAPCRIDVANCCLAIGTEYHTNAPTGQTLNAIPVPPGTSPPQCAAQLYKIPVLGICAWQVGFCGGATHTSACE